MRGKASTLALVAVLTAGLIVPALVGAATVLKSRMTGAQIVNDDGGSARGMAQATLRLNPTRGRLCFEIDYSGLRGKATGGYLRRGRPGQTARPAVVLFVGRTSSPVKGCVRDVSSKMLGGVEAHPGAHYVDLSTAKLPKGAVRGQLRAADDGGGHQLGGPPSGGVG